MKSLSFSSLFSTPTLTSPSLRALIEGGQSWGGKKRGESKYSKRVGLVFRVLILSIYRLFKRIGSTRELGSLLRCRSNSSFSGTYFGFNRFEKIVLAAKDCRVQQELERFSILINYIKSNSRIIKRPWLLQCKLLIITKHTLINYNQIQYQYNLSSFRIYSKKYSL